MCEAHPATTDNHTVSAPGNRPGAGPLRVRRVALRHGPVETGSMIIAFSVQPSGEPSDPKLARDLEPGSRASFGSEGRSEEHTSELQSRGHLVCRLPLEKKKRINYVKQVVRGNITNQVNHSHW